MVLKTKIIQMKNKKGAWKNNKLLIPFGMFECFDNQTVAIFYCYTHLF